MSDVDLSALTMEEGKRPPRPPLGPRLAIAALVLLVLAVAASFLVPLLRPVRPVAVAPVLAAGRAEGSRVQTAEAAGWVEPDPYPVTVRPLVRGVLAELRVLEGHAVAAGETVVGRLESAELEAARDRARAALALREKELAEKEAELAVDEALLEQKAPVRLDEAQARAGLAAARERLAAARAEHAAAVADRDARAADLEGQRKLEEAGGTYPVALAKAEAALQAAAARVAARAREVAALEAAEARAAATLEIAAEVLADPRALEGEVIRDRAAVAERRARRDAAATELAIAERELGWATVRAPVDGVVMKLLAAPGDVVGPDAHALVALYDPARLQARIDVPLASMEGVRVGQEVEVRSEILGGRVTRGVVDRIQRESDLLKNTLQVKVKLHDPDPLLRPETLVRARFLAPPAEGEDEAGPRLFRVPRTALRDGAVFLLDPAAGRARRVAVERIGEEEGDPVVRGPLSVTQKVILDPVGDGERVEAKP